MRLLVALLICVVMVFPYDLVVEENDDWKPVDVTLVPVVKGSALDLSRFVESGPAGKYGRVIISSDGHFTFEKKSDARVRFFGASLAPEMFFGTTNRIYTKEMIEAFAERVKLQGYNLLRPHFLDHYIMRSSDTDCVFNSENLDKFDYLVKCLKDRGIYLYIDAMSSWKGYTKVPAWTKEANAVNLKERMYYDESARRHWDEGVRAFLTHVNPYTGLRLAEDPIVAVVLGFNEQELNLWPKNKIPEGFLPLWREFLAKKYSTVDELKSAWGGKYGGAVSSFETAPLFGMEGLWEKNDHARDAELFLAEVETSVAVWYVERLRAMGYKGLVSQYDYFQGLRNAVPRNRMEVVSMHGYHAHPGGAFDMHGGGGTIAQTSAIGEELNWFRGLASVRYGNRPFVITEYGQVFWNRYRYEEGLSVGGYAALQDYDLLMAHASPVYEYPSVMKSFLVHPDPIARASQLVSMFLFSRRDAKPASQYVNLEIKQDDLFGGNYGHGSVSAEQNRIMLVTGFGISYDGNEAPASVKPRRADAVLGITGGGKVVDSTMFVTPVDTPDGKFKAAALFDQLKDKGIIPRDNRTDAGNGIYESETGELYLDAKNKVMTVKTARLEGVSFPSIESPRSIGILTVVSSTVAANVTAIALDDKPLAQSARLLIVYATDARNTGMVFEDAEHKVMAAKKLGRLPVLMRTGTLALSLALANAEGMKLYPLTMDGARRDELPVKTENGVLAVNIDTRALPAGPTPYFELVRE